jgi:hypothetical protein
MQHQRRRHLAGEAGLFQTLDGALRPWSARSGDQWSLTQYRQSETIVSWRRSGYNVI